MQNLNHKVTERNCDSTGYNGEAAVKLPGWQLLRGHVPSGGGRPFSDSQLIMCLDATMQQVRSFCSIDVKEMATAEEKKNRMGGTILMRKASHSEMKC